MTERLPEVPRVPPPVPPPREPEEKLLIAIMQEEDVVISWREATEEDLRRFGFARAPGWPTDERLTVGVAREPLRSPWSRAAAQVAGIGEIAGTPVLVHVPNVAPATTASALVEDPDERVRDWRGGTTPFGKLPSERARELAYEQRTVVGSGDYIATVDVAHVLQVLDERLGRA